MGFGNVTSGRGASNSHGHERGFKFTSNTKISEIENLEYLSEYFVEYQIIVSEFQ